MKKRIIIALSLLLAGCTKANATLRDQSSTTNHFTLSSFSNETYSTTIEMDLIKENIGGRVIGTITSVDGTDDYYNSLHTKGEEYTYGTFTVIKNFDGTLQEEKTYPFAISLETQFPIEKGYSYYMILSNVMDVHGNLYMLYPVEGMLLPVAEETLQSNSIQAYDWSIGFWQDVNIVVENTTPIQ